jgi:hypothetical protein
MMALFLLYPYRINAAYLLALSKPLLYCMRKRPLSLESSRGFPAISLPYLVQFNITIAFLTCAYNWLPFSPLLHQDLVNIVLNP